jgi:hypothetical protein
MRTPEGDLKAKVKAFLKERKVASLSAPVADAVGYYHMYVPSGYGDPALDFTGCYKGRFWSLETKAEGNRPSARQNLIIRTQHDALGFAIWSDSIEDISKRLGEFFDFVDGQS